MENLNPRRKYKLRRTNYDYKVLHKCIQGKKLKGVPKEVLSLPLSVVKGVRCFETTHLAPQVRLG